MKMLSVLMSGLTLALLGACTASVADESATEVRDTDGLFVRRDVPTLVSTRPGTVQPVLPDRIDFLCERSTVSSGEWQSLDVVETCGYYGPYNSCPVKPHTPITRLNLSNFCGVLAAFIIRWPYLSTANPTVELIVCLDNGMGIDCDVDEALSYFEDALPTLETDDGPVPLEILDGTPGPCSTDPDALCITAAAHGAVRSPAGMSVVSLKR